MVTRQNALSPVQTEDWPRVDSILNASSLILYATAGDSAFSFIRSCHAEREVKSHGRRWSHTRIPTPLSYG